MADPDGTAKQLFDDLLNLEVNTVVKSGMTGRKMPAIGHALLDTFSDYDIWLCKVGGELNAPWEGFRATQAALDFVGEMRAEPEVAKQWWVLDDDGELIPHVDVGPLYDAEAAITSEQFVTLRERARRELDMHRLLLANRIVDAGPDVMLRRIVRNCDQLKGILAAHGIVRGGPAKLTRAVPTGVQGARVDTFKGDEVVTIRKVWELSTETIVMQTVIQIDGDVVTRLNDAVAATEQARLRDVHREGVATAMSSWRYLVDTFVTITSSAIKYLTS